MLSLPWAKQGVTLALSQVKTNNAQEPAFKGFRPDLALSSPNKALLKPSEKSVAVRPNTESGKHQQFECDFLELVPALPFWCCSKAKKENRCHAGESKSSQKGAIYLGIWCSPLKAIAEAAGAHQPEAQLPPGPVRPTPGRQEVLGNPDNIQ